MARRLPVFLLCACATCGGSDARTAANGGPAEDEARLAAMTDSVRDQLLADRPAVAPEPIPLAVPRGSLAAAVVLRQVRAADGGEARAALWTKTFAGTPVVGQGVLVRQEEIVNPLDPEAPPATAFALDLDGDWAPDLTAIYFETDPDRIPFVERGQWLWFEGRLHGYDEDAGSVGVRVGVHSLLVR